MKTPKSLMNGEPWKIKNHSVEIHGCCDCNLTHMMGVDYDKKNDTITLAFYRDDYLTTKRRKRAKKKKK